MTEDFKKNILSYITNTINKTDSTDEEIFVNEVSIDRNEWIKVLPNSWNNFRYEGMVAPNETFANIGVLYGGYIDKDNKANGIITLFDVNFKPLKTLYSFSNGTKLRYIQYMKQAEDGTFYYVDDTAFSYSQRQQVINSEKRFVMVSNFTSKNNLQNDYEINFRKSYIFTGNYKNFYCKNMFKNPNSSHYIFFGSGADNTSSTYSYRYLKIIGLKINVGEANEWTMYANTGSRLFGSAYAVFDENDNVMFRCLNSTTYDTSRSISCTSKTYTGSVTTNSIASFDYQPYIDEDSFKKQSVFLNINEVYFIQDNQNWGIAGEPNAKYIGLYKYNFLTSQLTTIYEKSLGTYVYTTKEAIYVDKCNTDIYIQFNDNIDTTNFTADYYFQRLKNDVWNPILIKHSEYFIKDQRSIFIKSNFNLLQVYMYAVNPKAATWFQYLIKENYNSLNYNGEPYTNYNSMISKQGEIYSNNSLVFARNIYNRTINENQTVSTIAIPNNYLNDVGLDNNRLLSETNSTMIDDDETITKNIYETLFLNYVNSISVINEDTGTLYPNAATFVNTNINVGTQANCSTSNVGLIQINTPTPTTQPVFWEPVDDTHKETSFALQVNEMIPTIDFKSADGTTTYLTIDTSDLEVGETYTISQKLRIE